MESTADVSSTLGRCSTGCAGGVVVAAGGGAIFDVNTGASALRTQLVLGFVVVTGEAVAALSPQTLPAAGGGNIGWAGMKLSSWADAEVSGEGGGCCFHFGGWRRIEGAMSMGSTCASDDPETKKGAAFTFGPLYVGRPAAGGVEVTWNDVLLFIGDVVLLLV